ncbi:hypothetical protein Tco_1294117 [Tanacetum coccineum]
MMFTPPATYSDETRFGGVTDWYPEPRFMAAPVILISSYSSEESVGSSTSRVIWFGTIPTNIPGAKTPIIPPVAPEAEAAIVASPVGVLDLIVYSSTDSNLSDDLPSPEHASTLPATSPFLYSDSSEASSDSSNSVSSDRPLSPDSHETTIARWRSKIVPTPPGIPRRSGILVLPSQEIPLGRPYRTQPDGVLKMLTAKKRVHPFPARILANHRRFNFSQSSSPRKRRRSSSSSLSSDSPSATIVVTPADVPGSSTRVTPTTTTIDDSLAGPSRKRCRSPTTSVPLAIPALGTLSSTRVDLLPPHKRFRSSSAALSLEDNIEGSMEIGSEEEDIDSDVMADVEADITAEATTATEFRTEVDVRFEGDEEEEEEEAESSARGTVEIGVDRIVEPVGSDDNLVPVANEGSREAMTKEAQRTRLLDRIRVLKRDNMRLQGMLTMPTTRSGMTPEAIKEMITRREDSHGDDHQNGGGNGNGNRNGNGNGNGDGNGNKNGMGGGNGDGNPNMNARDFVHCIDLVELSQRTIGTDVAYAMTWKALMKLMTKVYCPRNEIQKMETELWNLFVKGNDLTAYTQRL